MHILPRLTALAANLIISVSGLRPRSSCCDDVSLLGSVTASASVALALKGRCTVDGPQGPVSPAWVSQMFVKSVSRRKSERDLLTLVSDDELWPVTAEWSTY